MTVKPRRANLIGEAFVYPRLFSRKISSNFNLAVGLNVTGIIQFCVDGISLFETMPLVRTVCVIKGSRNDASGVRGKPSEQRNLWPPKSFAARVCHRRQEAPPHLPD